MKKGFVADQARWIFVVIAGGVIFLFIFRVLTTQTASVDAAVAADLGAILTAVAAGVSAESTETVNLPERAFITYDCESRTLTVNGAQRRYVGDAVLFVKEPLVTSSIVMRVREFKIPYTAAIAVFVTDDIADLSSNTVQGLVGSFPSSLENTECGKQQLYDRAIVTTKTILTRITGPDFAACSAWYDGSVTNPVSDMLNDYVNAGSYDALNDLNNFPIGTPTALIEDRNAKIIRQSCPAVY